MRTWLENRNTGDKRAFCFHRIFHRPEAIFKVPVIHLAVDDPASVSFLQVRKEGEERDVFLHLHNPLRSLLLIQNAPPDLPTLTFTLLVSKLALPDAHPRRLIAEVHLGVIKDTPREPHAVLHEVDNDCLAIEIAVFVRVHLHLGVAVVVFHEHATLGKAGSNLLGRSIKREVGDEYCCVPWYLRFGSGHLTPFLRGRLRVGSGSRVGCVVDCFALFRTCLDGCGWCLAGSRGGVQLCVEDQNG